MERRVELFEASELVAIEITEPLPESGVVDSTYKIKGSVKIFDAIGAPPWVYAEVRLKEWYKPEMAEEVSYKRGFPMPITGEFTIDFKPEKEGDYEVIVLATPAPLSLPVFGVFPVTGKSDAMKIAVGERPPAVFRFSGVTIDGHDVPLTDHDVDSGLLLEKTTADYLDITPAFEWTGPSKTVTISVKAGYRDWLGAFSPKTGAYTRTFTLPESPTVPYAGKLDSPIRVPLTACGGLTDGAIEIVLKIAGEPDYISRIWNVYATKAPPEALKFDLARPSVSQTPVEPGTAIDITCPITSRCAMPVDARAKVIIYEGSLLPGHGAKIKEYDSGVFHIEPNESRNVIIRHTTVKGSIDRRDVEVEVYIDTQLVKESEWDDVFYVGVPPEEVVDFDLTKPSVSPAEIIPGTAITITCPVKSACTKSQSATAKVLIYEGSIYAGHGALIATKTSSAFSIAPGQTYNVIVNHTAIAGTIDRRDVEVEIYVGGKLIKESEWDDVYYVKVPEELIDFSLTRPTASPFEVTPGATVTITCPVKSACTKSQSVTAKVLIYEGSIYAGHGALITTKTVNFSISPNQTYNASISHTAVAGTIDRRDVEVEIYVAGKLVKESEWDDVYYVKIPPSVPPKADIQNLAFAATKGTYKIGDTVPFSLSYEYKGKSQSGRLVLSLGTGVYPSFFTVQTYSPMAVAFAESMDWVRKTITGGTFVLTAALEPGKTYNTRAKLETLEDLTQETDTDWGVITIVAVPVGVSFQVSIWGVPAFGSYQQWWAYYWDPGIGDFISCGKWYSSTSKIPFNNVQPGGSLAVFLKRNSTVSSQYTSPTFQAVNGGIYQYDVQLGRVTKIG